MNKKKLKKEKLMNKKKLKKKKLKKKNFKKKDEKKYNGVERPESLPSICYISNGFTQVRVTENYMGHIMGKLEKYRVPLPLDLKYWRNLDFTGKSMKEIDAMLAREKEYVKKLDETIRINKKAKKLFFKWRRKFLQNFYIKKKKKSRK